MFLKQSSSLSSFLLQFFLEITSKNNSISMKTHLIFIFLLSNLVVSHSQLQAYHSNPHLFPAQDCTRKTPRRLSKPLVRDDGRVYSCFERNFFAFKSNGSIAWSVSLNYMCKREIAPVHGGSRKIYVVAENRVLRINPLNIGISDSAVEIFYGRRPGEENSEIIGLAISILSSSVFINVKNRGLLAYKFEGQLIWSAGPILYQAGYRQGCKNNDKDCNFISKPVIDQCEASIYISNNEGELYALSVRSPHYKWVQDLSSFGKNIVIIPGNNGLLYATIHAKNIVLALDVTTGEVMWQGSIGPSSSADSEPVVDCNGSISFGSLDGYVYSFSPTGELKKFPKATAVDSVVQVSPVLDCSGFAVYISHTEMEGKISHTMGEYMYISAARPKNVVFTLLVPATGSTYWVENYSENSQLSSLLLKSDLRYFVLDEEIILAFITASRIGNPLPCRSTRQKMAISCSRGEPKHKGIYTGNERAILLFLIFETVILVALVVVVRFCCVFWKKKKLQGQNLGQFLEKRRSLQLQKKAFHRSITELQKNAKEETMANEVLEKLGNLVKEKEGIERKLSTTYSLGRDKTVTNLKPLLPLYDGKTKSFSFQNRKKGSGTIFHTLSETSEDESYYDDTRFEVKNNGKEVLEVASSSDEETDEEFASSSKGFTNPLFVNDESNEIMQSGSRSIRRRTLSSGH